MNESEIIDNVIKSNGHISDETRIARHPWIENVSVEIEQIKKEKQEAMEEYGEELFGGVFKIGSEKAVKPNGERKAEEENQ